MDNEENSPRFRGTLPALVEQVVTKEEVDELAYISIIKIALPALVKNLNADSRLPWVKNLTLEQLTVSYVPPQFAIGDSFRIAMNKVGGLDFTGKHIHADLLGTKLTIIKTRGDEEGIFLSELTFHNAEDNEIGVATLKFNREGHIHSIEHDALYQDGQELGNSRGRYAPKNGYYLQSLLTNLMLKTGDDTEIASGTSCTVIDGIKFYRYKELFSPETGYMESQVQLAPRRLPQVRDDLAKEFKNVGPRSLFGFDKESKAYSVEIGTALEQSQEIWWVSEDMSKLAWDVTHSNTGPEDLSDRDLPSPSGIMWLNGGGGPVLMTKKYPTESFLDTSESANELMSINAIIWYTPSQAWIGGLQVGVPRYMGLTASPDIVRDTAQWNGLLSPMDVESNEIEFHRLPTYVTYYNLKELPRQLALTVMRLAREESIGEKTMETTGGSSDKKPPKKKKRQRPISTITCASLRKNRFPSDSEGNSQNPEFSHRWIVRGHMRNQPYGPRNAEGGQKHERVWIAPYVKGPEDKPLVLKDRVQLFRSTGTSSGNQ